MALPDILDDALEESVIVECKGGYTVSIHCKLLVDKPSLFKRELFHCKRRTASRRYVLQTNLARRPLKRYTLWPNGSSEYAAFDPSLTAPELFLELNNLHIAAGILQDEGFENDMLDAMINHLVGRSHEMMLEGFLAGFLQDQCGGFSVP